VSCITLSHFSAIINLQKYQFMRCDFVFSDQMSTRLVIGFSVVVAIIILSVAISSVIVKYINRSLTKVRMVGRDNGRVELLECPLVEKHWQLDSGR
jgi:hypothetical protein